MFLEAKGFTNELRRPANAVLYRKYGTLYEASMGRPEVQPIVCHHRVEYQAVSWKKPRTLPAKVQWHRDELFPCVGFAVTEMHGSSKAVIDVYHGRGRAELAIKEGKVALSWTRLFCHGCNDKQLRPQRFVRAYNLGTFLPRLVLLTSVWHWKLTTLLVKRIRTGAIVVHHARYVIFQTAKVAVPPKIFATVILARIQRFAAISPKAAPI